MMPQTIILDNGAWECRVGNTTSNNVICIPNVVAKIRSDGRHLVGDETDSRGMAHHGQLEYKRPHARGCLVDAGTEERIWERALLLAGWETKSMYQDAALVVTEPPIVPRAVQRLSDEFYFETMGLGSVSRMSGGGAAAIDYVVTKPSSPFASSLASIVVDIGYSCCWITPMIGITPIVAASRRLDLGGKVLTNLLKEELTWRHVALMEETFVVDKIKRDVCFVSNSLNEELSRPPISEYVLPDYVHDFQGRILDENDPQRSELLQDPKRKVLRLGVEKFLVPEPLFDPKRVGLNQAGVPEAIAQVASALPEELQSLAMRNVLLCGGTCRFPGFAERVERELTQWTLDNNNTKEKNIVVVSWLDNVAAWRGLSCLASSGIATKLRVTRAEYHEHGSERLREQRGHVWLG